MLAKWITALRSNNYSQGTGALHVRYKSPRISERTKQNNNEYRGDWCCLGILAAITNVEHEYTGSVFEPQGNDQTPIEYLFVDGCGTILPDEVFQEFTGLPKQLQAVLAKCNDEGMPFSEIADILALALKPDDLSELRKSNYYQMIQQLEKVARDRGWALLQNDLQIMLDMDDDCLNWFWDGDKPLPSLLDKDY